MICKNAAQHSKYLHVLVMYFYHGFHQLRRSSVDCFILLPRESCTHLDYTAGTPIQVENSLSQNAWEMKHFIVFQILEHLNVHNEIFLKCDLSQRGVKFIWAGLSVLSCILPVPLNIIYARHVFLFFIAADELKCFLSFVLLFPIWVFVGLFDIFNNIFRPQSGE